MSVKQMIVIRKDLKMRRGKEIAQGSHASMAFMSSRVARIPVRAPFTSVQYEWMRGDFAKITVQVDSEEELLDVYVKAMEAGLEAHLITDRGLTEFSGHTNTAVAIGPDYSEKIDPITGDLKLY